MAGRMYAISTVGSLLGTFAAALLLIPLVGTQRTFLTFALITGAVAALGLRPRWALVPLAIAALMAVPVGTIKGSETGKVLHEADTEYQYARVVQSPSGVRRLELNEGLAIHSLYRPGSYLTGGYWDAFLVDPLAVSADPPGHVAILGTAGGTTARAYAHYFPGTTVDAVEIDGELLDIGRRYFDLRPGPRLRLHTADARPYLRATDQRFDSIFLDTYRQPYIPFYLTTHEFFALAHDRLNPGGSVLINVGHPAESDRLEKVLTATLGSVFAHVARDPIARTNTVLIASDTPPSRATLERAQFGLPNDLRPLAGDAAERLGAPLQGGAVYTDDRAPVEWLVDASIVGAATDGTDHGR
jgi:spermidine synthase